MNQLLSRLEQRAPSFPIQLLVVTSMVIVVASGLSLVIRATLPYPINVWEAGMVSDAARMAQGHPIYGVAAERATTMYSPLTTIMLSEIYEAIGPNLQAGRWLNIAATLAALGLILEWFARRRFADMVIALAFLLAIHSWTGNYYAETRPDMTAITLVLVSLLLLYRGLELSRGAAQVGWVVGGSLLLALAAFTKQTAIAYTAVAPVAMLLVARSPRRFLLSFLPFVLVLVGLICIGIYYPGIWYFMIEVPLQYRVPIANVVQSVGEFVGVTPLFILAFVHWLLTDASRDVKNARIRWLMTFLAIASVSGCFAAAKEGGTRNSLIPALLGMGAFCAWRMSVLLELMVLPSIAWTARSAASITITFLLLVFAGLNLNLFRPSIQFAGLGDDSRPAVISEVRTLPGRVISPDDPTIALLAKGYAGRSAVFQADAVHWDSSRIEPLNKEIASADWVILLKAPVPVSDKPTNLILNGLDWWPREELLRRHGFKRVAFKSTSDPLYQLWQREK